MRRSKEEEEEWATGLPTGRNDFFGAVDSFYQERLLSYFKKQIDEVMTLRLFHIYNL